MDPSSKYCFKHRKGGQYQMVDLETFVSITVMLYKADIEILYSKSENVSQLRYARFSEDDRMISITDSEFQDAFRKAYESLAGLVQENNIPDNVGDTYDQKYYLIREIKKAGFDLILNKKHRTITISPDQINDFKKNKYAAKLVNDYGYGIQLTNTLQL
jgi:hypothetical protein